MIPALYLAFYIPGHSGDWLAVIIFSLAAITDFFDGWMARKFEVQSGFGRMLDPVADKLMVAASLILLVEGDLIVDIHLIAAIIILCREILVSGLREYLMEIRIALPVSILAKYKTTIQMVAIGFLLSDAAGEALLPGAQIIGLTLLWIAALFSLITGYDYMRKGLRHAGWNE